MAVAIERGAKVWRRRDRARQLAVWAAWLVAAAVFVACGQLISDKTIWAFVTDAPAQAADLGVRMVPPDWAFMRVLWRPLWDTINIATLGTVLAIVVAIPVAYCAARNTTPSAALVRPVALFLIVSSRSINSLIWALMLVTIVGPGVFAGILAIGLRSIGFCAKLLYEAIEEIDERQVEAVRATGASRAQVTAYGIVPQVLPAFAGICGVSLGHQHPRIDGGRAGRRRRHRPAAQCGAHLARLDAGVADPAHHHRDRGDQRMGVGQGAPRHHLEHDPEKWIPVFGKDHAQVEGGGHSTRADRLVAAGELHASFAR